jgi:hypothetical protein
MNRLTRQSIDARSMDGCWTSMYCAPRLQSARPANHGAIVEVSVRVGDMVAPQSLYRYAANANLYHLIDAHCSTQTVRVVRSLNRLIIVPPTDAAIQARYFRLLYSVVISVASSQEAGLVTEEEALGQDGYVTVARNHTVGDRWPETP